MITDYILKLLANLFIGLVSILPNASPNPGAFESAWNWFGNVIAGIVYVLNGIPTDGLGVGDSLIIPFTAMITLFGAVFLWNGVKDIYNAIRGSGV